MTWLTKKHADLLKPGKPGPKPSNTSGPRKPTVSGSHATVVASNGDLPTTDANFEKVTKSPKPAPRKVGRPRTRPVPGGPETEVGGSAAPTGTRRRRTTINATPRYTIPTYDTDEEDHGDWASFAAKTTPKAGTKRPYSVSFDTGEGKIASYVDDPEKLASAERIRGPGGTFVKKSTLMPPPAAPKFQGEPLYPDNPTMAESSELADKSDSTEKAKAVEKPKAAEKDKSPDNQKATEKVKVAEKPKARTKSPAQEKDSETEVPAVQNKVTADEADEDDTDVDARWRESVERRAYGGWIKPRMSGAGDGDSGEKKSKRARVSSAKARGV